MVSALLAVLTAVGPPATPPAVDNPPIRVSLNSDAYYLPGDRARVRVRAERDGYVMVLRADVNGRVRVLFPLDPGDDNFVRGNKTYTLRGRGDRETFIVDDETGNGTILAAFSLQPFQYNEFVRGDHWDYRVLASERVRDDPEAGLLALVTDMAGAAHFDYDVIDYAVTDRYASAGYGAPCFGCGYGFGVGYGYGHGYGWGLGGLAYRTPYAAWLGFCDVYWDPFRCDPWYYDPFFGFGFGFRYGFGNFYYPYYYPYGYRYRRPYGYGCFGDPFCYDRWWAYSRTRSAGPLVFKTGTPPPVVVPRQRSPIADAGFVLPRHRREGVSDPRARPPVAEPRRRGDGVSTPRARPPAAEPRRRSPSPSRPDRPRSAEPRKRSPSPAARPARPRTAEPRAPARAPARRPDRARPRTGGRQHSDQLPVDVSPGRNRRVDAGRAWSGRLPVDVSPGRSRRAEPARAAAPSWMTPRSGSRSFGPELRPRLAPRSGGARFTLPTSRRSLGGFRRTPTVRSPARARPAPRRN